MCSPEVLRSVRAGGDQRLRQKASPIAHALWLDALDVAVPRLELAEPLFGRLQQIVVLNSEAEVLQAQRRERSVLAWIDEHRAGVRLDTVELGIPVRFDPRPDRMVVRGPAVEAPDEESVRLRLE